MRACLGRWERWKRAGQKQRPTWGGRRCDWREFCPPLSGQRLKIWDLLSPLACCYYFFLWLMTDSLSNESHPSGGGIYGSFLQANPRADLWKVFIPSWVRVPKTKGMKQFKQVRKYLMTRVLGKRTGCDSRKRGRRFYVSISSIFFSFKWSAALNPFYSCLRALGSHFNTLHTPHFNQPLLCLLKIHTGGIF